MIVVLLVAVFLLFLVNISIGSSRIPMMEILQILFTGEGSGHKDMIVINVRLPMALMTIAVGICLGIGGCEIQTILRNPIASPYTLGITNAATFGAALGLINNTTLPWIPEKLMVTGNAFLCAVFASVCIFAFSRKRGANKNAIILFGMAMNFMFSALTMIMQYIADDEDLKSLVFWSMGSMLKSTWGKFWVVFAVLIFSIIILVKNSWKLTAMTLDDTKAKSLGVDTNVLRRMVILICSLITAVAVSFVGTIGFVGIIAPHIARQLAGEDQRFFMPLAALIGALVLSVSFAVSKVIIRGVIFPIGLVTAVIGIPVFMFIVFKKARSF